MERNNEITLGTKPNRISYFVTSSFRYFVQKKGFTMVELIIVAAIIAIMSVASIVGFGYLGDTLKTREVSGILGDLIKQEELKILRGDFVKATIHFLKNYIVIEEAEEGYDQTLLGLGSTCADDNQISYKAGVLTQKDGEGEIIDIRKVDLGGECVKFYTSPDNEWNYKLNDLDKFSGLIRFIHFNVQREDLDNPIIISNGVGTKIELTAPYGKKIIYDHTGNPQTKIDLTVEDTNGRSTETLTLQ